MKRSIKKRVAGTFIGVMALTLVVIGVVSLGHLWKNSTCPKRWMC